LTATVPTRTAAAAAPRPVALVPPSLERLAGYARALEAGWSPDESRDIRFETLAALRSDPAGFVRGLLAQDGTFVAADGTSVPRLPFRMYWIDDGEFCGTINLRWRPGSEQLPPYVSGHIGYGVVPWKRNRGYARRALALLLPEARAVGLRRVLLTCDDDNLASRRVILANGGVFAGTAPHPQERGKRKLLYWIDTASPVAAALRSGGLTWPARSP
jgi:predicted acetyltransferase